MTRYRIDTAYHGRDFHGWQRQPDLRTVQGELEMWLARILGSESTITINGAGRTDAGVHALCMPAHFDLSTDIDAKPLEKRLRVAMPADLRILRIHRVAETFRARHSAVARRYSYRLRLGSWPFGRDREWQVHDALDPEVLKACAGLVLGRHDFSAFCRTESLRDNNYCKVHESSWVLDSDRLVYTIRADRFLHEMVRFLVGTFVGAARGRWTPSHISEILRTKDVGMCGDAAPAHGLTLEQVDYPPGVGVPVDFD